METEDEFVISSNVLADSIWIKYTFTNDFGCNSISNITIAPINSTQVYVLNSGPLLVPIDYTVNPSACENETMTFNYEVTPDTSAIQTDVDVVTLDSQGF